MTIRPPHSTIPVSILRKTLSLLGRLGGFGFVVGLLLGVSVFVWYFCRIEPGSGEIAVLIRKTGDDLPPGAILAVEPRQKGIQFEVLPEGRYFRNPYAWDWRIATITSIPAGKVGVLARLYGRDPPPGRIVVAGDCSQAGPDDEKGILAAVLRPGNYRIWPATPFTRNSDRASSPCSAAARPTVSAACSNPI